MLTRTTPSTEHLLSLLDNRLGSKYFMQRPSGMYDAVIHAMSVSGKRIRPLLLLQAYELFRDNPEEAVDAALAIEMFHNFTLAHDDIMDNADLRRGQPTLHRLFGANRAILAGDMLLCHSYGLLCRSSTVNLKEVLDVFNRTAIAIMEGQQLDMQFEQQKTVSEEEYLDMIEKKTSVLLAASLQIGAIIGGASKSDRKLIYEFGRNLGLMFQIKDDLLDAFGTTEKVGKRIGGDIVQNKKTYLLVCAMNLVDDEQRSRLTAALSLENEEEKIKSVKGIFEETGAREKAEDRMKYYFTEAVDALKRIAVDDERKAPLYALAGSIHSRQH